MKAKQPRSPAALSVAAVLAVLAAISPGCSLVARAERF